MALKTVYAKNGTPMTVEEKQLNVYLNSGKWSLTNPIGSSKPTITPTQTTPQPALQPQQPTGINYTIKSGDTLSALAKNNKTTVAELLRLNPSIQNPNLIYAGKSLVLPGAQSSLPVPQAKTMPDYSQVSDIPQATAIINQNQQQDAQTATPSDTPPEKKSYTELNSLLNEIVGTTTQKPATTSNLETISQAIEPKTEKPKTVNLEESYQTFRTQYGVSDLENQSNTLQTQLNEITAAKQTRINAERGKTVATNVIAGRVSEVERQENERITAIQNQITSVNNQLTTKYNVINNLMKLRSQDYENAVSSYDKELAKNVSMFNVLRGLDEEVKSENERQTDNARASLQILYNSITSGGANLADMPVETKTLVTKLETQAGLPPGFYETLKVKNPKAEIVSTYNWTSSSGQEMASVLTKDPSTGEIKTNNIVLGTAKQAVTGSSTKETKPTEAETKLFYKQSMQSQMKQIVGKDGYVSPKDWAKARQSWTANTPYTSNDFDDAFRGYVNPKHPQDYAGLEIYKPGFIKKSTTEQEIEGY